ncbi:DUF7742 family protein [Roseobacter sp. CCS2]|uniref:DUF7742 family protein n=1 Tax=Roseobacter sp. CCS2 TaxID=391593 RepID=UPI0000F40670|nr:hypothetical protein [Roseobacter sp. CCS2]EBA11360.1 hypothetical protein RCCS2_01838 [Roseobacter sp. CCS2]
MRPVQLADIEMTARVLMQVPVERRVRLMQTLIGETECAEAYRLLHGAPHPQFGVGSLLSRAVRMQAAPRPAALEFDALDAYCAVVNALLAHQTHQTL